MDHRREQKVVTGLHPEKSLAYLEMSAAAYRKKLRKTLDKSQKDCLKPLHYSSFFLPNAPMMATISIIIPSTITIGAATILRKSNMA